MREKLIAVLWIIIATTAGANDSISQPKHWGVEAGVLPGRVVSIDKYQKQWMRKQKNCAIDVKAVFHTLPSDSDAFSADYGFPTLALGLRLNMNHGVTMHKSPSTAWPFLQEADYDSELGNIVSAYFQFTRPLWRTRKWEASYSLAAGTGWSRRKYNTQTAIDNEIIGSRWLIYFGAGLHLAYQISPHWAVRTGLEFYHHSNGATNRPNKGANMVAPLMAVAYTPGSTQPSHGAIYPAMKPYWYASIGYGLGFRTMLEEWQITQFQTQPGDANYRTGHFRSYRTHHIELALMRRYARRWASGIGVDAIYADCYKRAEQLNRQQGHNEKLSPWSLGISAKHEVFYHSLSLQMAIGAYLFRKMGHIAHTLETPYYERIGLAYQWGPVKVGACVKAHKTKADLTEITVSLPIKMRN